MKTKSFSIKFQGIKLQSLLATGAVLFVIGTSPGLMYGQTAAGLVGGVARESVSGKPVAEAQIVAHNLDRGTDRSALSNGDGIFAITNLEPGLYDVAATKNGFQKSSTRIQVAASRVARVELALLTEDALSVPREKSDGPPLTAREKELLERVERLERLLSLTAAVAPGTISRTEPLVASLAPVVPGMAAANGAETAAAPAVPQAPPPPPQNAVKEPFAFADFTWLTGNPRTSESPLDTKYFTPEIRVDVNFTQSFNQPKDNTIGGSSEIFRSGEVQLTQLGVGGDLHYEHIRGRLMTQLGLYSQTTPRNDASPARGQWNLDSAYRYVSEAYGGYHFDKLHGINVDAGIFMSYIGLFSYYQFDNWAYQPSYVSSNTPWFFNGVRVQIFPSEKLKIEPWFINGWQSYGKFNKAPGVGGQILWRPNGSISVVSNNYYGTDTLGNSNRKRVHTDDSIQVKYLDRPANMLSKAAFTFTADLGCEWGGGVTCSGGSAGPAQYFMGFMAYNRLWFNHDRFAFTLGGGAINNPGRYLVLVPPINGATAFTGASPYFTANPGDTYKAWDGSATFDYLPSQFFTWRFELNHRAANIPYFSGGGGITPPGGNTGSLGSFVPGWSPDLRKYENRFTIALLLKI